MTLRTAIWMVIVASMVALCAGCAPAKVDDGAPNILLISIDALRADHLSCYSYDRRTSPELDRLAAHGTRFSNAFVNTHGTPPSHATLLSSLYQESHRVGFESAGKVDQLVPEAVPMVQEFLAAAGWHTVAVTGGGFMSAEFGFSRGFGVYIDNAWSVERGTELLIEELRSREDDRQPVFAFLHTYQVHSPYEPPDGFQDLFGVFPSTIEATSEALLEIQGSASEELSRDDFEYLEALYDGEIRYTDEVLGRLLSSLDDIGFLDNAVVVVTSDHGEEFGDHGGILHGGTLFEELLHVPLIISGSGIEQGRVEPALVSLIDVAPTLMSIAGLEAPDSMEGRNILDGRQTGEWEDQRVFAQYGGRLYCVRTPRWKLLQWTGNQRTRLFDLRLDPRERRDVSARYPELTADLLNELEEWRDQRARLDVGSPGAVKLKKEKVDELRALGYVD